MENRVYYGEYSLKHWIELVLKQNITLPDYQRYFVWDEKKVKTLIETFKNKQFVPPVTIGAFKKNETNTNLILDGQQRITSILLAYLGLYPDDKEYKKNIEIFMNDNDDNDDNEEDTSFDNVLEWNINYLTQKGKNKETILSNIIEGNYKEISLDIDDNFLETNFLGFSYLVPQNSSQNVQQKYYSSVFRNINIQGEALLPQESRASLYFLDEKLVGLFRPDFCKKIVIKLISSTAKADFVRYLSLLSQYHKDEDSYRVARGYKQKMEKLYEEYIHSAISTSNSGLFSEFLATFPDKLYSIDLENLETTLNELSLLKEYPSIIDIDTCLFGVIYFNIFKKSKIDTSKKEQIIEEINENIAIFKNNPSHLKSPNNLGHLRTRISLSVEIYGRYILNESQ